MLFLPEAVLRAEARMHVARFLAGESRDRALALRIRAECNLARAAAAREGARALRAQSAQARLMAGRERASSAPVRVSAAAPTTP